MYDDRVCRRGESDQQAKSDWRLLYTSFRHFSFSPGSDPTRRVLFGKVRVDLLLAKNVLSGQEQSLF